MFIEEGLFEEFNCDDLEESVEAFNLSDNVDYNAEFKRLLKDVTQQESSNVFECVTSNGETVSKRLTSFMEKKFRLTFGDSFMKRVCVIPDINFVIVSVMEPMSADESFAYDLFKQKEFGEC